MATMKKQAKAEAVKKGTFYECHWCGKEGTDALYDLNIMRTVCGRAVINRTHRFCSLNCMKIDAAESNRRMVLNEIEWANRMTGGYRAIVTEAIENGEAIHPTVTQIMKMTNIYKKVLILRLSGDRRAALKLYADKKATITDCVEDVLADKDVSERYMAWVDRFSRVEGILDPKCHF
jgi:hypothetical protein